jgi:hypothetical protein
MTPFLSSQLNPAFMISTIFLFLEFFAYLEKGQFFRFYFNLLAGFGVSTGLWTCTYV